MSDESNKGDLTFSIKKDAMWKYATVILAIVVVIFLIMNFTGNGTTTGTENNGATQIPAKVSASIDDDASIGEDDAEVTIIEFSDYECPFCQRAWAQTLPLIKSEYVDEGKVKYVFRDFTPTLSNPTYHPDAVNAAMAAECVGEQGGNEAYFEMHDKIFENQGSNSVTNLKALASDLGYNIDSCLDSQEMKSEVQADYAAGQSYGIRGTPGFLIGSDGKYRTLSGACPFSAFQQAIELEIAGSEWYSPGNCQVVAV